MNEYKVTINEMVAQMLSEIGRLGYTETSIWKNFFPKFRLVADYYEKMGISIYDPGTTDEYVSLQKERLGREEITVHFYKRVKYAASRMNEFYLTGTVHINAPKRGSRYTISDSNERLIDQFLEHRGYGPNTRDDVRWVVRRYLHYFEKSGHGSLGTVTSDDAREFILDTAAQVKTSSLHNILLYLRHFHIFLKEMGIAAPDCVHLFSYKICREMPIQGYVTDGDLKKILDAIDTSSETGKRDRAIRPTAATTGLRASDIIQLKLSDIDWRKGEIRTVQRKTGQTVYCPIVRETGEALQYYILNARPSSGCEEVFLRASAPRTAIMTGNIIYPLKSNVTCTLSMWTSRTKIS